MWSVGCLFAGIIFGRYPFFRSYDSEFETLLGIVKIMGSNRLFDYVEKYEAPIESTLQIDGQVFNRQAVSEQRRKPWKAFRNKDNEHKATDLAIDLLDKMMRYDHAERITAYDAMRHPYFDKIRAYHGDL